MSTTPAQDWMSLCSSLRSAFLPQMQWLAWSWWRPVFPRRHWPCWQCPWCLCRSSCLWSLVNTLQDPDLWMSSTRPFPLGSKTLLDRHMPTQSCHLKPVFVATGCLWAWSTPCWCGGPPVWDKKEGFLCTTMLQYCSATQYIRFDILPFPLCCVHSAFPRTRTSS